MAKKRFKPEQIVTLLPISFATDAEQLERYAALRLNEALRRGCCSRGRSRGAGPDNGLEGRYSRRLSISGPSTSFTNK